MNTSQENIEKEEISSNSKLPNGQKPKFPSFNVWIWLIGLVILNYFIGRFFTSQYEPVTISYTLFKDEVKKKNVKEIYSKGTSITGNFINPVAIAVDSEKIKIDHKPVKTTRFVTELPSFLDEGLETFLSDNGVIILAQPIRKEESPLLNFLIMFGPSLLIIGFYLYMFRRQGNSGFGGFLGMGSSHVKRFDKEKSIEVTFNDVAGIDEAKNELKEVVDFLKNPQKYTKLGGTSPKGVLLIGAPGTGKTLLAKATAGEAGVPFFSMSASEFVEMIVGVGAARVRDLFKQARENAPSIIFIDELDAIGRSRGAIAMGGSSEQEQTLNQILTEMDGFTSNESVIVIAATNQPNVLDKALLRPGRFDRRVVVNLPDKNGREAILKVHTRKVPLSKNVNLQEIASATIGLSGADIKNLVNEAALMAAKKEEEELTQKDFMDALEKIILGPQRPLFLSHEEKERIAYHESGHALLGLIVPGADPVNRVTIVPRGQALGVTYQRPVSDRYNYPEAYLRARIIGMLGGRSAEEIIYGTKTTGAENDIEQATALARNMVTRWGMSDTLGLVQFVSQQNPYLNNSVGTREYSEETAKIIDAEVSKIINDSHEKAIYLLTKYYKQLDSLAEALMEQETLDEQQILNATGLQAAPELDNKKILPEPEIEKILI